MKKKIEKGNLQDRFLAVLYGTAAGRIVIRPLVHPAFSVAGGKLLSTKLSALAVKPFIHFNKISLEGCEKREFDSFNDFFTRKLMADTRPVSMKENEVIAPCDGRLSVYPIRENGRFLVKGTSYTLEELLKDEKLAKKYYGGNLWLYRLCVDDYHRYIYPESGIKSNNCVIPGVFHTVNPVANEVYPIYKENTREFCLVKTEKAGTMLLMEVGAMLVGKIENHHLHTCKVERGQEKGNFAFGGSTIIVLTQKDKTIPAEVFQKNTSAGIETKVRLGQMVGCVMK